jgi:hypothetical protein
MNFNFSKKWTLRILAAFFFLLGVLFVIFRHDSVGYSRYPGISVLWPFVSALLVLVSAQFVDD